MGYSIGEFSALTQLSIDTLRYYEKEQLIAVRRDAAGRRCYMEEDIGWIHFIKRLKETGMPIKEIKTYALLRYEGNSTMMERLDMLKRHRLFVLAEQAKWDSHLSHLEEKIQIYEDRIGNSLLEKSSSSS
ncbi:MerR family transcriptional regulator [Gorillibacterium timonense]|uniref:MerR family transcriptional regulator n=1 Tax=Gorillibacterium timonense TaxID=1689269 RepID=UPI00071DD47D|nr:MerR family transcriptional regulator [Gorillibacterium timonense]